MAYVTSVLQPGETVKVIGKPHWIVFVRAIFLLIVGAGLLIFSTMDAAQKAAPIPVILGGIVFVLGVIAFLLAWFERSIVELAVTNHRVIYKKGFIRRHTVEMNMDKVETVNVDQSVMGRLLGFGTIRVLGTGQGIETLNRIGAPIRLRNAITAR